MRKKWFDNLIVCATQQTCNLNCMIMLEKKKMVTELQDSSTCQSDIGLLRRITFLFRKSRSFKTWQTRSHVCWHRCSMYLISSKMTLNILILDVKTYQNDSSSKCDKMSPKPQWPTSLPLFFRIDFKLVPLWLKNSTVCFEYIIQPFWNAAVQLAIDYCDTTRLNCSVMFLLHSNMFFFYLSL